MYRRARAIDNCNFSAQTVWSSAADGEPFVFDPTRQAGRQFIADATLLGGIADRAYAFVLASHTLEHVANPLRALAEWNRVLTVDGLLILVLPQREHTFDHRRSITAFSHLLDDFAAGRGEDDLTHLAEILNAHDLSRDPAAGTFEQFKARSERNVDNRCLHHHVFDRPLAAQAVEWAGFEPIAAESAPPHHLFVVARKVHEACS